MINFNSQNDFKLEQEKVKSTWISNTIKEEKRKAGDIDFVFCTDDFLYDINLKFLDHDTLTDIISFDYSVGKELHGEIYISTDRVKENAEDLGNTFKDELDRVIIHGILHLCGYKDRSEADQDQMRAKEDYYLNKRL